MAGEDSAVAPQYHSGLMVPSCKSLANNAHIMLLLVLMVSSVGDLTLLDSNG